MSIFSPAGFYPAGGLLREPGVDNPPLHASQRASTAPNAVYHEGDRAFPDQSFNASNYWVDVVF